MNSLDRKTPPIPISLGRSRTLLAIALSVALCAAAGPAWSQERYDEHELTDRFYITLGGFSQSEIRTTFRLDVESQGGITLGTVIALEKQFDLDDQVSTGRLDGWYRFNERHRIGWTYWQTERDGVRTYDGSESIVIGDDVIIDTGDTITIKDDRSLIALDWSYSFVNTSKYEAWLGAGLNFQRIDTSFDVSKRGGNSTLQQDAKGTVPIPTLNLGGRWDFSKRWRMFVSQELFGIKVGDFEGKLNTTRVLAEFNITRRFGIGGGFERYNFEVDAKDDNFLGRLDSSFTGLSLYLKGQL